MVRILCGSHGNGVALRQRRFRVIFVDFDNDNLITKEDIMVLCDRLTKEEQLGQQEKQNIADLVRRSRAELCSPAAVIPLFPSLQLLQEMDLQNNGNLAVFDFVHAMSKMPEFQHTFSCRL